MNFVNTLPPNIKPRTVKRHPNALAALIRKLREKPQPPLSRAELTFACTQEHYRQLTRLQRR